MKYLISLTLYAGACLYAIGAPESPASKLPSKEAAAPKSSTQVETPLTLPGAETFIYHDVKPEPMRLHVFKPKGWKATDRRPALVHFFGGGFIRGIPSPGQAKQAAEWGLVGIAADYRVKTRHNTDGTLCIADARAALRWVQVHAEELGLDPARVVVSGSSAGGGVALWTAITASPPGSDPAEAPLQKPAALVLLWPAADFSFYAPKPDRFGGHAMECSPVQHLDPKMPPSLLLHGDKDPTVPYQSSVNLHRKLTEAGNVCEFITMTGCGHGATLPEWKQKLPGLVEKFLRAQNLVPAEKP